MANDFEQVLGYNKKEKEKFFIKGRQRICFKIEVAGEFWEDSLKEKLEVFLQRMPVIFLDRMVVEFFVGNNFYMDDFRVVSELIGKRVYFIQTYTEDFPSEDYTDKYCYIMQNIYRSERRSNYCRIEFEYQEKELNCRIKLK